MLLGENKLSQQITIAFYGNISDEKVDEVFAKQRLTSPRFQLHSDWSWQVIHPNKAKIAKAPRIETRKIKVLVNR